jgi:hypothetical protein
MKRLRFNFQPEQVRISTEEILSDLRYPAPAATRASKRRRPRPRPRGHP